MIAGRHAVVAALRGGGRVRHLYLALGIDRTVQQEIAALAEQRGIPVSMVDRSWLDERAGRVRHQGMLAQATPLGYAGLGDLLAGVDGGQVPLLVALDQVQDPHNLGSVIRTGAAAGAHGLVVPARRSAGLTEGTLKAAAGAAEAFPVARVTNLSRALDELRRAGVWAIGADASASTLFWQADFKCPLVLVIGGEDRGLGRLVREKCDFLVRIPMHKGSPCLNASVAAGILLFEAVRQRSCALLPGLDMP